MDINLERRLKAHVEALAKSPRVPGTLTHKDAMDYIVETLQESGFSCVQPLAGRPKDTPWNVLTLPEPRKDRPLIIVGAHYDTVRNSPGADDNASGVAALLEIASAIYPLTRRAAGMLQLAAYDMEENGLVGSMEHCKRLRTTGRSVKAMFSLEMLGFKSALQDPAPGIPTPARGDFLAVVSNEESRGLLDYFDEEEDGLPLLKAVVPRGSEAAQMARLSDHGAFWAAGHPALLVTDTAFLRNPHYHQPTDRPGTLDYKFLADSTRSVFRALERLIGVDRDPSMAGEAA